MAENPICKPGMTGVGSSGLRSAVYCGIPEARIGGSRCFPKVVGLGLGGGACGKAGNSSSIVEADGKGGEDDGGPPMAKSTEAALRPSDGFFGG